SALVDHDSRRRSRVSRAQTARPAQPPQPADGGPPLSCTPARSVRGVSRPRVFRPGASARGARGLAARSRLGGAFPEAIMSGLRLVVLGMMGRSPFGGQTWLYLNWLRAFSRLGHDVWYVEDDSVWPYDPEQDTVTDDCRYAVRHIAGCLDRIGLSNRWAYRLVDRDGRPLRCGGLGSQELDKLFRSCDAL